MMEKIEEKHKSDLKMKKKTSLGLDENVEGALAYVLGVITGIIFLLVERENEFVKFHAMQSTITFLGLFLLNFILGLIPSIGWILGLLLSLVSLIFWILGIIKAYQGELYKFPIVGDIVENQLQKMRKQEKWEYPFHSSSQSLKSEEVIEARKIEEELKKTRAAMSSTYNPEEARKLRDQIVTQLSKLAIIYDKLGDKNGLTNVLEDLKHFTDNYKKEIEIVIARMKSISEKDTSSNVMLKNQLRELVSKIEKDNKASESIGHEFKANEKSKRKSHIKGKTVKEVAKVSIPGFPPELLKKYEPLEFLGEGGFAKVFKVKRKEDGKIVALKIPRIDEKTSKVFLREVSTWLHLDHPNIVKLYEVDILPIPHLEMEYIEGVNADGKIIRNLDRYPKPIPEERALKMVKGIAEGLKHAHSKGIYHRDLKPLNVLLKSDLTPKIADWGLAKIGTMSSTRSVMGYTPLYAAPEQLMPSRYGHTDQRTDIWQLGVTFYELLTGKLPFEGYTSAEVFGKIVDENYKSIPSSKINPNLAKYDGIFEKLLAKRKENRYQSVEEFLKDLEKLEEVEKRKAELEMEVEELKDSLTKTMAALKQSKSAEEALKNRKLVVETLGKLALAYAELNRKAELLNTLNDLKFYTVQNLADLTNAITTVEMLLKEGLPVSDDFTERLKVLIYSIKRENEA